MVFNSGFSVGLYNKYHFVKIQCIIIIAIPFEAWGHPSIITIISGFSIKYRFGKGTPNRQLSWSLEYGRRDKSVSTCPKIGETAASQELGEIPKFDSRLYIAGCVTLGKSSYTFSEYL